MPRAAAATTLPEQSSDLPVLTPFDTSAKKVLKLTFREALSLSADNVGTEHILLTLLETRNGNGNGPIRTRTYKATAKTQLTTLLSASEPRS